MATRTTQNKTRTAYAPGIAALLAGAFSLQACTGIVMPDADAIEPAQRVARLEELHRVSTIRTIERQREAIARWVAGNVYGTDAETVAPVAHQIIAQARAHDLDPYLVAAVITVESYYNHDVISYAGAVGLMQVIPYVGRDVALRHGIPWDGWQTLLDPERNIAIGTAYLRELIDMFDGDMRLALAAYNMGPTLLRQRLKRGFEPRGPYVSKVTATYRNMCATDIVHNHFKTRTSQG